MYLPLQVLVRLANVWLSIVVVLDPTGSLVACHVHDDGMKHAMTYELFNDACLYTNTPY